MGLREALELAKSIRGSEKGSTIREATVVLADRITELEAQRDELLAVCKKAITFPAEAQEIMRKNNLPIDDLDNPYQKLAFTFYSTIAEYAGEVERMIADWDEINQPGVAG